MPCTTSHRPWSKASTIFPKRLRNDAEASTPERSTSQPESRRYSICCRVSSRRFAAEYPGIEIRLHNVTGRDGLERLRGDSVDFAVGAMFDAPGDIIYRPLFTYPTVLITPFDHPLATLGNVTLDDIAPYGLILPPRHLSTWRIVDIVFQQHKVEYKVNIEAGGWEVIKRYVARGLGVSIVSSICMTEEDRLAAIPLDAYFPSRTYGVVLRRGKFLTPAARRFLAMIEPDRRDTGSMESSVEARVDIVPARATASVIGSRAR